MRPLILAATLSLATLPAVAQEGVITPGNTLTAAPAEWLGATPHLVVMGSVAGRPLDIQFTDMAAAQGVVEFAAKREYLPGDAGTYRYGDFEIALKAVIGDVERALELEFENDDFRQHALPAAFALQSEAFPKGLLTALEVETEWEDASGSVNDEVAGWTGTLTLAQDSGTADDKGLLPDGMIAGHLTAQNGADTLVMSFTVPVAGYEIDN